MPGSYHGFWQSLRQGIRRLFDTANQDQTLEGGRWPSSSAFSSAFCFSNFSVAITISRRYFAPSASEGSIAPSIRPLLPSMLRNSGCRDAEPSRKSKSRIYGTVCQTTRGSHLFPAPCSHRGQRCYGREPCSLELPLERRKRV